MLVKTSELKDAALDWAVAKCEGGFDLCLKSTYDTKTAWVFSLRDDHDVARVDQYYLVDYSPSTDWALGGTFLESYLIAINIQRVENHLVYEASIRLHDKHGSRVTWFKSDGPTPLIAAMRCYVASKLGDEVEIPEELYANC